MPVTTEISFERTPEEDAHMSAILDRAEAEGLLRKSERRIAHMDLAATHANGCPLDLTHFEKADAFSFAHDFFGIAIHLDRATGRLMDSFIPRCAKKEG